MILFYGKNSASGGSKFSHHREWPWTSALERMSGPDDKLVQAVAPLLEITGEHNQAAPQGHCGTIWLKIQLFERGQRDRCHFSGRWSIFRH